MFSITTFLNCPWDNFQPDQFPVCEEQVCSWVREPGNTVSNLAYFMVGFILLKLYMKKKNHHDLGFALTAIFIGVCSTAAHATGIHFFGFFDFAAVFSIFSLLAAKNMVFAKKEYSPQKEFWLFGIIYFISLLGLYFLEDFRNYIFAGFVVVLLAWEYMILKSQNQKKLPKPIKMIFGGFAIGVPALILDANHILCYPNHHYFQLHMLWHVAMAFNIFYLAQSVRETRLR